MLSQLKHTNSSFDTDIKEESGYVEQEVAHEWLSLEEAKKLKIRMLESGIDLEDMFKDVKLFSAGDKFDKTSEDYVQEQVEMYEAPVIKNSELRKKILSGEKLSDKNSFRRVEVK